MEEKIPKTLDDLINEIINKDLEEFETRFGKKTEEVILKEENKESIFHVRTKPKKEDIPEQEVKSEKVEQKKTKSLFPEIEFVDEKKRSKD